jgi:hypothetical protein
LPKPFYERLLMGVRFDRIMPFVKGIVCRGSVHRTLTSHRTKIDCRVKPGNDEEVGIKAYFVASAATASPAALSPESLAPCAVEKKFGEVASPAKNKRPSTGAASTARAPAWPGSACE